MNKPVWIVTLAAAIAASLSTIAVSHAQAPKPAASFTADGKLEFPKDYRTWIYLSSGLDMTYGPNAPMAGHLSDPLAAREGEEDPQRGLSGRRKGAVVYYRSQII